MSFAVIGTDHKYSPIETRERISFSGKRIKNALDFLMYAKTLKGAAILSTCNRVEIYVSSEDADRAIRDTEDFISRYHEIPMDEISPFLYTYREGEALKHLLKVACGLESLITGETQILGQVASSIRESETAGHADLPLRELFYSALSFGRRMRKKTKISEGKVSVGSIAVDFIRERTGALSDKNILIIGAGKAATLVSQYLKKEGAKIVFIANKTFAKAMELARGIGARAVRFDRLKEYLKEADIVITATGSPHVIIKKEALQEALNDKLLIMDLGLPRDVDGRVRELENVELYRLEDLHSVIDVNKKNKAHEAAKIKEIIEAETGGLWKKFTGSEQEKVLLP